jgi:UDP-glucose 4-epimerase
MKIGITGAAGFIGSHLCETLLQQGHRVIAVDNLSYGSTRNLFSCFSSDSFQFSSNDILEAKTLHSLFQDCEVLIHLAALKIPRYDSALATLKTNTEGSENVLKIALETKAKVLLASTSDVYGKNTELPFHEESALVVGSPTVKRWAYAISKMYEEQLAFAYADQYRFPLTILRFFGGYGPRHHLSWRGGPQSVFIQKALEGATLPLHGNGQQTRTFTYISDILQGILLALHRKETNSEVFNIGSTEEISIADLARLIWKLLRDDEPQLNFVPYEDFGKYEDVLHRKPCLKKAQNLLGFVPHVSLKAGLLSTIAWHRLESESGSRTPEKF